MLDDKSIRMKFFLLAFLLCIIQIAIGQNKECKLWLGEPYDTIDVIKQTAEKYLQFELKQLPNEDNIKTMYEMRDSEGLCILKIWMKQKKVLVGGAMTSSYTINSIKITCLAERIDAFFTVLKEKVAVCTTEATKTNAVFSSGKMFIENQGGDFSKKNIALLTLTITPL